MVVLPDLKRCEQAQCRAYCDKTEGVCCLVKTEGVRCLVTALETGNAKLAVRKLLGFAGQNPTNR
jgi:hypothetical protein